MWQLPPDAITSLKDASMYLNANEFTFRTSYKRHGVPHTMVGGQPVFFPAELDEWRRKNPNKLLAREAA